MQARKVEERIKAYPEFSDICARECSGECQEILSFATFVHTSKESYLTGEITLEEECAPFTPTRLSFVRRLCNLLLKCSLLCYVSFSSFQL